MRRLRLTLGHSLGRDRHAEDSCKLHRVQSLAERSTIEAEPNHLRKEAMLKRSVRAQVHSHHINVVKPPRTLKFPSHDSRKQTAKAVQTSVPRLNRAGMARLHNTIGAHRAALIMLPGAVLVATCLRYTEIKTQYAKNS